jgi:MFS family permease
MTFFYLFLVDFLIATQSVLFSVFPESFIQLEGTGSMKIYLLSFILSFFVFCLFSGVFKNHKENERVVRQGLAFFMLGNLICLLFPQSDFFILGIILSGLATGMILLGQIGIIWITENKKSKKFSFWMVLAFFLGFFIGPYAMNFLSGPNFDQVKVFSILGATIAFLAIFFICRIPDKIFSVFSFIIKDMPKYIRNKKRRLAILGIGYLGNAIIVYGFDYFLYPYVIWKFGILKGGAVMTLLSFIICYVTILFYDWAKQDWLGIEIIKEVKEYNGKSMIGRFTSWILKKSEPVVLIFLSIKFDPFITTAYMRKGAEKYNGLGKRDWVIFMSSLFVGNVYWTFVAFTGVSVIEYAWKFIS